PGPSTTVATATGSMRRTDSTTSGSSGQVAAETGSTKTSMMPPHVRPTANASSSVTPYRCSTGRPDSTTSCARSYTAPSTQPPLTLPTASPPPETAMAAPAGRGADFQVRTTVANPNGAPAS